MGIDPEERPAREPGVDAPFEPRPTDWDLMGSIGHELRHTLEVIAEPSVRSDAARFFLYERIGRHETSRVRETQAATDAGATVRSELLKFNREAKSK
jgi:hypothetical protein